MESRLIYTIEEVFSIIGKEKKFVIPSYQRGYKWNRTNIEQLLNDINNYHVTNDETFYCLQNITLVDSKDVWHVVDGQQRLTTLILLLSFLGEHNLVKGRLDYQVRKESNDFIKNFICKGDMEHEICNYHDWQSLIETNEEKFDFQDIYYMFMAYLAISEWFKGKDKDSFKKKLLDKVCLIVNRLDKNTKEQELFKNLNGGKIDLDGADLIRAIVVTREARNEVSSISDRLRNIVMMNENRVRIGNKLDEITRWWSDSTRQRYFDYFIRNMKIDQQSPNQFQDETHPINYLYKLLFIVSSPSSQDMSLRFFEEEMENEQLFDKIVELQRIIEDWYEDRTIYHLALYTNIYNKTSFKSLYDLWNNNTRQNFIQKLKDIVYNKKISVELDEKHKTEDVSEIEYLYETIVDDKKNEEAAFLEDYYGDDSIEALSVLLDIIDSLNESLHLPNLKPEYFKRREEDKEHIFPQTPIGKVKDKYKATEILRQYLNMIQEAGVKIDITDKEINWDDEDWKKQTAERINRELMKIIPLNSLGNVCLLDRSVNRSYGNDFYSDKRVDIISKSRKGFYIRPHVIDAFDKAFLNKNDDDTFKEMKCWNKQDILSRRKKVIKDIYCFLKPNEL